MTHKFHETQFPTYIKVNTSKDKGHCEDSVILRVMQSPVLPSFPALVSITSEKCFSQ